MNIRNRYFEIGCAAILIFLMVSAGFAQGSLTPPGPPEPTMKSLSEIDANVTNAKASADKATSAALAAQDRRIEINSINTPGILSNEQFRIEEPGSYYLGGNITGESGKSAITIFHTNVSLDLNGYALLGVPGSLDGVEAVIGGVGARNIVVRNGTVKDWGRYGINAGTLDGGLIEDLVVTNCGDTGIKLNDGFTVSNCVSYENGGDGIEAVSHSTIVGCTAASNSGVGIRTLVGSTISNCTASLNQSGGIFSHQASTISNSTARGNAGHGITARVGCGVFACTADQNTSDGIQIQFGCQVVENNCFTINPIQSNGAGIHATNTDNRIEGNNVTRHAQGIKVDVGGNFIIRNSASGNTTNYDITGIQTIGPIISATGTITSTNPWANFEY
ncbi:MAG: right-handed parallel beta-helix repeat-containing protein [bacterium]